MNSKYNDNAYYDNNDDSQVLQVSRLGPAEKIIANNNYVQITVLITIVHM